MQANAIWVWIIKSDNVLERSDTKMYHIGDNV